MAEYLVSLALEGRVGEVSKLLDGEGWLLRRSPYVGVAVRLLLKRLGVKVEKPEAWEVAGALRDRIDRAFQPAFLFIGLYIGLPEEGYILAAAAVRGDENATSILKTSFLEWLGEIVGEQLKGLAQSSKEREAVERFHHELQAFVEKRDAGNLVQLLAPETSLASFVLMLWALSNGDEELARAHAKRASIFYKGKLPRRLFREAAEARGEGFELALQKLFYYHF